MAQPIETGVHTRRRFPLRRIEAGATVILVILALHAARYLP